MTLNDISNFRLHNQQVSGSSFRNAKDLASWMGALQAQDYNMAKWAIGVRLPDSTDQSVEEAFRKGELIRTHLMRPTWHIVSSDDIYWILDLTAPHLRSLLRTRHLHLELNEKIISKSKSVIEKILEGGNHLTRDEIKLRLQNENISIEGQRAAHLMMICELDGLVCSGSPKGKEQTYALLRERVPKTNAIHREEALSRLAKRYFTSHGPATLQDFSWWSGLPAKDARLGLELVKTDLVSAKTGEQIYWFKDHLPEKFQNKPSTFLLPAYDEFIISYRDRKASILAEDHKKAISENGLFRPIVVENGHVTGTWKRTIKKKKVLIETDGFCLNDESLEMHIENASKRFGQFLNCEPVFRTTYSDGSSA